MLAAVPQLLRQVRQTLQGTQSPIPRFRNLLSVVQQNVPSTLMVPAVLTVLAHLKRPFPLAVTPLVATLPLATALKLLKSLEAPALSLPWVVPKSDTRKFPLRW